MTFLTARAIDVRPELEDLAVRGPHPSTHISWYAEYAHLAYDERGTLVGALLAHPGHFAMRGRPRLTVPGWFRVTNMLLTGATRTRLRVARALVAYVITYMRQQGYRVGYVTLWAGTSYFERIRHLMALVGGSLAWTEPLGEGWTWHIS